MKICLLILSFLSVTFANPQYANEKICAKRHGLPLDIIEKYNEYVVCDYEEMKVPLRQYMRCLLEHSGIMNTKGEILETNEGLGELIKTIPEMEDKNEFAYILTSKGILRSHRAVPPNCKGNLSKAWLKCAKDNGLPEYNTEETLKIIKGTTEPSDNFKQFLLCGLKDQEILTSNGELNTKSLEEYKHKDALLKIAKRTVDYKDSADYAYKITKSMVLEA